MNSNFRASLVIVVTAAAVATAVSPAQAQTNSGQRPYKALFGGSAADPDVHHSLDLSATVAGGYEDNVVGSSGVTSSSPLYQTGYYTGLTGALGYAWYGKRVQIGATAGTESRYYADQGEFISVNHFGAFGLTADLDARTKLSLNQSVTYSPAYMYDLFPAAGDAAPGTAVGLGDPLTESHVYVYDTNGRITRGVSQRGSIEAQGNIRYSDYSHGGGSSTSGRELRSYSIGGRYGYNMTRYAALRLGYIYRNGSYGVGSASGEATAVHDIDAGIDYRRPLSLTRRTTVDFAIGSSIVNRPTTGTDEAKLQYRVAADVGLSHEMFRTWSARLAYRRGIGFAEGFAGPVFADAVTGSLHGFFSNRLDFSANGGMSIGNEAFDSGTGAGGSGFKAYTFLTRMRYGLGSMWALYGEYQFYRHQLGDLILADETLPRNVDRNSVRAGLNLWFPLLRR